MASLTSRQQRFVAAYLDDLDPTNAARKAGYSQRRAAREGARLLACERVQVAIALAFQEGMASAGTSPHRILRELAAMAFANMADYVRVTDEGYADVDLTGLTRENAAAIQEIVVDAYSEGRGEDKRAVKRVRLKLADKKAVLNMLARAMGLYGQTDGQRGEATPSDAGPLTDTERAHRILAMLARARKVETRSLDHDQPVGADDQ